MSTIADPPSAPNPGDPTRDRFGRLRSRHNARTHGLTAALPDGEAEAAAMQAFADRWAAQLGSEVEAEEALIRAAAVAYARFERCRKAEEAALRDASRLAVERWERRKRHAVRRKAQDLARDPIAIVAELETSSFGCEWLQRHWQRLDAKLAQGVAWDPRELAFAMTLLGLLPMPPGPGGDPIARQIWSLARIVSGDRQAAVDGLPGDPEAARVALRRRIAEEFDRLDRLRADLWEHQDGPEAEAIARSGLVDSSKEGQLRQRYRREAFSEMIRGINQVMRIRVERSRDDDRQWRRAHTSPPRPHPEPAPPPIPAGSRDEPPLPSAGEPEPSGPGGESRPGQAGPSRVGPEPPSPPTPSFVPASHRNEPPKPPSGTDSHRRNTESCKTFLPGDAVEVPEGDRRTEPSAEAPAAAPPDARFPAERSSPGGVGRGAAPAPGPVGPGDVFSPAPPSPRPDLRGRRSIASAGAGRPSPGPCDPGPVRAESGGAAVEAASGPPGLPNVRAKP
ncbi:hypothetical protein [Tautonia sociabilis]|uniref:Uncharacterized protein n=1 Tax=Tautonia sociabilis TaxID=2080755 RepID=A0A432MD11_9BACT|nr:hypothetical protein [Tautonia sociabilis]RUL82343.1 hypothetical protein TsocGM_23600 [Tautonia sociabilis]